MARRGIFSETVTGGKKSERGDRLQGEITREGSRAFEIARVRLAKLVLEVMRYSPAVVSDADTIEFLARGEAATRRYLIAKRDAA